jgi:hypothetical protein
LLSCVVDTRRKRVQVCCDTLAAAGVESLLLTAADWAHCGYCTHHNIPLVTVCVAAAPAAVRPAYTQECSTHATAGGMLRVENDA